MNEEQPPPSTLLAPSSSRNWPPKRIQENPKQTIKRGSHFLYSNIKDPIQSASFVFIGHSSSKETEANAFPLGLVYMGWRSRRVAFMLLTFDSKRQSAEVTTKDFSTVFFSFCSQPNARSWYSPLEREDAKAYPRRNRDDEERG